VVSSKGIYKALILWYNMYRDYLRTYRQVKNTEQVVHMTVPQDKSFAALSPEEKKRNLYEQQKHTLELFLERNAISRAQFDKSLKDLTVKMGFDTK